jgi:hypothetical protein
MLLLPANLSACSAALMHTAAEAHTHACWRQHCIEWHRAEAAAAAAEMHSVRGRLVTPRSATQQELIVSKKLSQEWPPSWFQYCRIGAVGVKNCGNGPPGCLGLRLMCVQPSARCKTSRVRKCNSRLDRSSPCKYLCDRVGHTWRAQMQAGCCCAHLHH